MAIHSSGLLEPSATALLVVDVQERFRPAMPGFDSMLRGAVRLVRVFRLLGLPILITEQYPKGLGPTVEELRQALDPGSGKPQVPEKTTFSSLGSEEITTKLRDTGARCVLVCGIEAHVCVNQTVHGLLAAGYEVHVATDAIDSRHATDRETALRRMERSGATLTTTEMAAFELLQDAQHPRFKDVQALFK